MCLQWTPGSGLPAHDSSRPSRVSQVLRILQVLSEHKHIQGEHLEMLWAVTEQVRGLDHVCIS